MAVQSSKSVPCFDQSEESVLHDDSATYEETECDIESFTILSDSDEDHCLSLENEQENNTANNGWIQVADRDSDQPHHWFSSLQQIFLVLLAALIEILQHMSMLYIYLEIILLMF